MVMYNVLGFGGIFEFASHDVVLVFASMKLPEPSFRCIWLKSFLRVYDMHFLDQEGIVIEMNALNLNDVMFAQLLW